MFFDPNTDITTRKNNSYGLVGKFGFDTIEKEIINIYWYFWDLVITILIENTELINWKLREERKINK